MKTIHHSSKGFTIIEVSLVLAIAGLIFVMIFVALPALQRQSRDAKRREDTLTLISAIKKYQQNNRGSLPTETIIGKEGYDKDSVLIDEWSATSTAEKPWAKFYNQYLGDDFKNPENDKYSFVVQYPDSEGEYWYNYQMIKSESFNNRSADWFIFMGATCKNDIPDKSSNLRNVAVVVKLETDVYCAST